MSSHSPLFTICVTLNKPSCHLMLSPVEFYVQLSFIPKLVKLNKLFTKAHL